MEFASGAAVAGLQDGRQWRGSLPEQWPRRSWIRMGFPYWGTLWPWVEFALNTWILVRFFKTLFSVQIPKQCLMMQRLQEIKESGDSAGGVVEIRAQGCPAGLGEPVFAKLDAALAGALMGIGAVKGVEIGSGFAAAEMLGSENNDPLSPGGFLSNNSGGILGGISNGDEIVARVAVKPISSIEKEQETNTEDGESITLSVKGRHDVSAIPRIVPVCTAMVRLVLADMLLQQKAIR
jgi:chorismate synthase